MNSFIVSVSLSSVQGCCQCASMGMVSIVACAVEPQECRGIRKQISEAGTDHDNVVFEFFAFENQRFEVDRPIAAQPEDDRSAFMVDTQFHGSHSILPKFGRWYTVSVEDDLRIDKDTADLAGRSAVLFIQFAYFSVATHYLTYRTIVLYSFCILSILNLLIPLSPSHSDMPSISNS